MPMPPVDQSNAAATTHRIAFRCCDTTGRLYRLSSYRTIRSDPSATAHHCRPVDTEADPPASALPPPPPPHLTGGRWTRKRLRRPRHYPRALPHSLGQRVDFQRFVENGTDLSGID